MIGILNLNSGNLRSVTKAVYELGYDYLIIENPSQFNEISHLIIPGVGQFQTAMQHLHALAFLESLQAFHALRKPILGICLGMHLLATVGFEGGKNTGLNLIYGQVMRFNDCQQRVPHSGWNTVEFVQAHPLFKGIKNERDFYFVHSYYFECEQEQQMYGCTEYGMKFASVVAKDNVVGVQFHPEKSQKNGLTLLENFCQWDGKC